MAKFKILIKIKKDGAKMNKYNSWSCEEINILIQKHAEFGESARFYQQFLPEKSLSKIANKMHKLRLISSGREKWTDAEDRLLAELFKEKHTYQELSTFFNNKDVIRIRGRVKMLGLRENNI